MEKPKVEGYTAGDGDGAIGFKRTDFELVHVIIKLPPGTAFPLTAITDHFERCDVCRAHGVVEADFMAHMTEIGAGPFPVEDIASA